MASVYKRGGSKAKGNYYAEWYDHTGKRRCKSTRTTDKAAALRIAKKHEADAALRREGVIDSTLDAIGKESRRTVESHLADYEAYLRAADRTDRHIVDTIRYVRKIATAFDWSTVGKIKADDVNKYATNLKERGLSARTIQAYLAAIKAFSKWLAVNDKLPRDPLASVSKPDPKTDPRHVRRYLLPAEWQVMCRSLQIGPERQGMTAHERKTALLDRNTHRIKIGGIE